VYVSSLCHFSVIFPKKGNRSNFCHTYGFDGLVSKPTGPKSVAGFCGTPDCNEGCSAQAILPVRFCFSANWQRYKSRDYEQKVDSLEPEMVSLPFLWCDFSLFR